MAVTDLCPCLIKKMHCLSDGLAALKLDSLHCIAQSAICECDVAKSFYLAVIVAKNTPALETPCC